MGAGLAALWVLDAVLAVLVIGSVWKVAGARRDRARHVAAEQEALLAGAFTRRARFDDLTAAWEQVLERTPSGPGWLTSRRLIARLCDTNPDQIRGLREAAEPLVNSHNLVAAAIDDGLVRPVAFVRRYPALHLQMLQELELLEPIIWFESLIGGRGRWGYGPLHLKAVLTDLRPVSDDAALWSEIRVTVFGQHFSCLPALARWERVRLRAWRSVHQPRINVHTKLRQRRHSHRLVAELQADGYPAVPLFQVLGVTDW